MEMKAQFHRRVIPAIKAILLVILIAIIFSCASLVQQNVPKDLYKIINESVSMIEIAEKGKIYIDTTLTNALFIEELNDNLLVTKDNKEFHFLNTFLLEDELFSIFNLNEVDFMTNQLQTSFLLDLEKIKIKNIFKYQKPVKKVDEKGTIILTDEILTDHSKKIYRFSKPVFTLNKKYSVILVYKRYSGHWIEIYKKQEKEWSFYKKILLGIE